MRLKSQKKEAPNNNGGKCSGSSVSNQGHNGIQSVSTVHHLVHKGACLKVLEQILPGGQLMLGPLNFDRQVVRQVFTFLLISVEGKQTLWYLLVYAEGHFKIFSPLQYFFCGQLEEERVLC